jgi:hypothetical protein
VSTPEGLVKQRIKAYLKTLPECWFFLPVSNGMGTMGIPDIICCYRGRLVAIEVKAPGKVANTTPLQDAQLKAIRGAHGFGFVTDDVATVKWTIELIDAHAAVKETT